MEQNATQNIEITLLLEAIYMKYGYDFRNYSRSSIQRRILQRKALERIQSISEFQFRILYDEQYFDRLLQDFSINTSEMFRDPHFYDALRGQIIPKLNEYASIKIWHAGCSSGEEVYSMAIMLKEEGLYDRALIYATDFNKVILHKAKEGIYPLTVMRKYTENYQNAGGKRPFSEYYTAQYNAAVFDEQLKQNIVFAEHNLVTDGVFGEMNLIVCRNVLIYFNETLKNHVLDLFYGSLMDDGYLALGTEESIQFTKYQNNFSEVAADQKIYRKLENTE